MNQFSVLDAYVGLAFSNWQLSFGRQSLWWGPGDGGPLIFSDNAAPLNMFRINRVTPLKLPSILGWLGPLRLELFLGQLSGQQFINGVNGEEGSFQHTLHTQPMIHGERFTFKPTRNFEFGFSRTGIFAGQGVPFTLHTLEKSFFSLGNGKPGTTEDPGIDDREWIGLTGYPGFAIGSLSMETRSPKTSLHQSHTGTGQQFVAGCSSRISPAFQNLICGRRVCIPTCRPEDNSVTAISTRTPDI